MPTCTNVAGVMYAMDIDYARENWPLFVVSSIAGLKAVLLHNGSIHPRISIANTICMKETYETLEKVFELINYSDYVEPYAVASK